MQVSLLGEFRQHKDVSTKSSNYKLVLLQDNEDNVTPLTIGHLYLWSAHSGVTPVTIGHLYLWSAHSGVTPVVTCDGGLLTQV